MKVAILVMNNFTSDSRVLRQAQTFAAAGHETMVIALRRGDTPEIEVRDGFVVQRVHAGLWTLREGFPQVSRTLGLSIPTRPAPAIPGSAVPDAAPVDGVTDGTSGLAHPAGIAGTDESADLTDVAEEAEPAGEATEEGPTPSERLSREQWIRWVLRGGEPSPRSWTGASSDRATRATFAAQLAKAAARKRARKLYWKGRRKARRMKRKARRRVLKPVRYRNWEVRMMQAAIDFGADVVWSNDVTTIRAGYEAGRALRARMLYDAHELYWESAWASRFRRWQTKRLEHRYIGYMDGVVTVCEPIARTLQQVHGIPKPQLVYNCPRLSDSLPVPSREGSPLREQFGPSERIVLFHGGMQVHRGLEQLIEAMRHLPVDVRLVLMGNRNGYSDGLLEQAAARGLADRVTWIPPVPSAVLTRWVAGADVGVIPYQNVGKNNEYSTPNKLFECMHAGLPIVVNDLPQLKRFVTEIGFGVVCDCTDPVEIAKAIQELLDHPPERERMRANALAAAATYSWEEQERVILGLAEAKP